VLDQKLLSVYLNDHTWRARPVASSSPAGAGGLEAVDVYKL
jgi:hypothetical protein